jgi:2-phosphosulfolactate phosphatase
MAATDLPPPPPTAHVDRPTRVLLHPRLARPDEFRGSICIVIDNLRASTTIVRLLECGASRVVPCMSVEDARTAAAEITSTTRERPLLAGERGGVLIDGFDMDNSPRATNITAERVAGRPVCFTTTNGTAALLLAKSHGAEAVLIGCLANRASVCESIGADTRPVVILCAGTREDISLDDCLPAGAMIERLIELGRGLGPDDSSRLCLRAWREALSGGQPGILAAMLDTRGGRNLSRIGLSEDVRHCARVDDSRTVPRLVLAEGMIVA